MLVSLKSSALALSAALLFLSACQGSRPAAAPGEASDAKPAPKAAPSPEAQILRDEAVLKKPHAIIGGTVQNVGGEKLEGLSVEIELKRRDGGDSEVREVVVEPASLGPGEEGRYTLKVLSEEWGSFNVLRLRSAARPEEVAVKILPGAKRPPLEPPQPKVVVTKQPRQKSKAGDDFINTPDTPISVP